MVKWISKFIEWQIDTVRGCKVLATPREAGGSVLNVTPTNQLIHELN